MDKSIANVRTEVYSPEMMADLRPNARKVVTRVRNLESTGYDFSSCGRTKWKKVLSVRLVGMREFFTTYCSMVGRSAADDIAACGQRKIFPVWIRPVWRLKR